MSEHFRSLPRGLDESPLYIAHPHLFERLRKPISFAIVGVLLFVVWGSPATLNPVLREIEVIAGFVFVAISALGRMWSALYIAGRKNAVLCVKGPYSLCRNPLYLFSSLGLFGVLLATHRPFGAVLGLILFWGYYTAVIRCEESRLAGLFGADYEAYRVTTPAIVPRFDRFVRAERLEIHMHPMARAFLEVWWFFAAWLTVHLVFIDR